MQPTPAFRILLIDDHHLFNDGLKALLNKQPDLIVCGQVFHARDALPAVQQSNPHLILLDINLHGNNGIDLGKAIITSYPTVRVMLLTMYNQPKLLDEARRAGLHGYLLKDATTVELLERIRDVLGGAMYFDTNVAVPSLTPSDPFGDPFARLHNLTFREVEIIALIRQGCNNEQIAQRIHLSIETVKTHRKNVYFKLGINKATDLVRFAIEHGL